MCPSSPSEGRRSHSHSHQERKLTQHEVYVIDGWLTKTKLQHFLLLGPDTLLCVSSQIVTDAPSLITEVTWEEHQVRIPCGCSLWIMKLSLRVNRDAILQRKNNNKQTAWAKLRFICKSFRSRGEKTIVKNRQTFNCCKHPEHFCQISKCFTWHECTPVVMREITFIY